MAAKIVSLVAVKINCTNGYLGVEGLKMGTGQMGDRWGKDFSLIIFSVFFLKHGKWFLLQILIVKCNLEMVKTRNFNLRVTGKWCCCEPSLKLWHLRLYVS